MPFSIVRNDIAHMKADVIVNAANERLLAGGGVCGAIFKAAGTEALAAACAAVAPCPTGHAVSTPAFGLDARWVVHAVGPRWVDGHHGEETLLRSAYRSALELAASLGATSVALPLLSAGLFGYPPAAAFEVACSEVRGFLARDVAQVDGTEMDVSLVVFDRAAFAASLEAYDEVGALIDDAYAAATPRRAMFDLQRSMPVCEAEPAPDGLYAPHAAGAVSEDEIAGLLESLDASFSETLLQLIDARGLADADVYKRANISRQLFSKIRHDHNYRPTKQTAVAFAVALELDLDQAQDLLSRAGLALSASNKFDVIVMYFINRNCYDIYKLNAMLFAFDQPLLGSM